jgi:replication fork clamp-binding protein CrfC
LGCLTKVDIMHKGTNARQILFNEEIPLKYGYVAIKNRDQQDIMDNVHVSESLLEEKKFFSTNLIYSTLPRGCTGT